MRDDIAADQRGAAGKPEKARSGVIGIKDPCRSRDTTDDVGIEGFAVPERSIGLRPVALPDRQAGSIEDRSIALLGAFPALGGRLIADAEQCRNHDRNEADAEPHRCRIEHLPPMAHIVAGDREKRRHAARDQHQAAIMPARGDQDDNGIENRDGPLQRAQYVKREDCERQRERRHAVQAFQEPAVGLSAHPFLPQPRGHPARQPVQAGRGGARSQPPMGQRLHHRGIPLLVAVARRPQLFPDRIAPNHHTQV